VQTTRLTGGYDFQYLLISKNNTVKWSSFVISFINDTFLLIFNETTKETSEITKEN